MGEGPGPWVGPVGWAVADLSSRHGVQASSLRLRVEEGSKNSLGSGAGFGPQGQGLGGSWMEEESSHGNWPSPSRGQAPWTITTHQWGPEALG